MAIGRPPIGPKLGVRLPPELREELEGWAWNQGVPLAEFVRRAVERECARLAAEAVEREIVVQTRRMRTVDA